MYFLNGWNMVNKPLCIAMKQKEIHEISGPLIINLRMTMESEEHYTG